MENDWYKDITAVTVNWLSAENTKRAILAFQKFYPDIPVVVVDDDSKESDKGLFFSTYNSGMNNAELMYDSHTEKLKTMKGVIFYSCPSYDREEAKGHGKCVDIAIGHLTTKWMFHFHSDWRMTKMGLLEKMMEGIDDMVCAVGDNKTRADAMKAIWSVTGLYNVDLGKKHNVTFQPVIYHQDGTVSPFPGSIREETDIAIEAGSYYTGKLVQLGYKIKNIVDPHKRYGVHLRWKGDGWNGEF